MFVLGSLVGALDPAAARHHVGRRHDRPARARPARGSRRARTSWRSILLIGLAVGVDYSLFYMRRERQERAAGRSESAALEAAAATSGRAVLVSGMTVLIAMAGMFLSGDKTFMSFSVGTMIVVAVAMLGSLTVLPAVLSRLGDRVEKGRIPFIRPSPQERREPPLGRDPRPRAPASRSSRPLPRARCSSRWLCRRSSSTRRRPVSRASRTPVVEPFKRLDRGVPGHP